MKMGRGLVTLAATAVLLAWVVVTAWGQGTAPAEVSGSRPTPQAPAVGQEGHGSSEEEHESGWAGLVHEYFPVIHKLGQAGSVGLVLNLVLALLVFVLFSIKGAARTAWRYGHMRVGLVFGIAAMAHGTAIDLAHLTGGDADELLHSGSWLCTMTLLVVLTGLVRFYGHKSPQLWRWAHRLAVIAWIGFLCWHVIPKVLG
ncbi:MAG: hypothetical protein N2512_10535 [Armatimonadetes bacterium]|nr:hypothetical protein [Armatimonadota bacterium]